MVWPLLITMHVVWLRMIVLEAKRQTSFCRVESGTFFPLAFEPNLCDRVVEHVGKLKKKFET